MTKLFVKNKLLLMLIMISSLLILQGNNEYHISDDIVLFE